MKMFPQHDEFSNEPAGFRDTMHRFWNWLCSTVAGHERGQSTDAVPYVPCYYDE